MFACGTISCIWSPTNFIYIQSGSEGQTTNEMRMENQTVFREGDDYGITWTRGTKTDRASSSTVWHDAMTDPMDTSKPFLAAYDFALRQTSWILNMGIPYIRPGSSKWVNNSFTARLSDREALATYSGNLEVDRSGFPQALYVRRTLSTTKVTNRVEYLSRIATALGEIPNHFIVWQLRDGSEELLFEARIRDIHVAPTEELRVQIEKSRCFAKSATRQFKFHKGNLYSKTADGIWLQVVDTSPPASIRLPPQKARLSFIGFSLGIGAGFLFFWRRQGKSVETKNNKKRHSTT